MDRRELLFTTAAAIAGIVTRCPDQQPEESSSSSREVWTIGLSILNYPSEEYWFDYVKQENYLNWTTAAFIAEELEEGREYVYTEPFQFPGGKLFFYEREVAPLLIESVPVLKTTHLTTDLIIILLWIKYRPK